MYRYLPLLLILGLCSGLRVQAQNWTGSAKIGAASSTFGGDLAAGSTAWKNLLGFAAGGSIGYVLDSGLGAAAELLYLRLGAEAPVRYFDFPSTLTSKITYLALPVILQYKLQAGDHFSPRIFAGPSGLFKMDAIVSVEDREIGGLLYEEDQSINSLDWGFMFGGGLDFEVSNQTLTLEVRYFNGRMDVTKPAYELEGSDLNNQSLIIMAGIVF